MAATAMRTWPGAATGVGTASYVRFSAGPKACRRMAFMVPVVSMAQALDLDRG